MKKHVGMESQKSKKNKVGMTLLRIAVPTSFAIFLTKEKAMEEVDKVQARTIAIYEHR